LNLEITPVMALPLRAWWIQSTSILPKDINAKFNSLVILITWSVWRERNARVFDRCSKPINILIEQIKAEAKLWSLASKGRLNLPGV
jgi:hypothetical protein